jgi:hypothetical protein
MASSVSGEKSLSGEKNGQNRLGRSPDTSPIFRLNRFEITRFFPDGGGLEKSLVLGNGAGRED